MQINLQFVNQLDLLTCLRYVHNSVTFISLLQHRFLLLAQHVTVGHSCLYNLQCTGTQFASVCNNDRCECHSGYILIDNNCYPGKERVYIKFYFESLVYTYKLLRLNFGELFIAILYGKFNRI